MCGHADFTDQITYSDIKVQKANILSARQLQEY